MNLKKTVLQIGLIFFSASSFAQLSPGCMAKGHSLAVNNAEVIQWKNTTQNKFRSRAHITGTLTKFYPDYTGHHHYEVQIGTNAKDLVEVIYNEEFGIVPQASPGAKFEACGDYITANSFANGGRPSPDGAIVHWVHRSTNTAAHDSGYIAVNGIVCGQK